MVVVWMYLYINVISKEQAIAAYYGESIRCIRKWTTYRKYIEDKWFEYSRFYGENAIILYIMLEICIVCTVRPYDPYE